MKILIYKLVENTVEDLYDKNSVAGMFIDLTKAFDCVQHSIISQKLSNNIIRSIPFKSINLFLQNIKQCVDISGVL